MPRDLTYTWRLKDKADERNRNETENIDGRPAGGGSRRSEEGSRSTSGQRGEKFGTGGPAGDAATRACGVRRARDSPGRPLPGCLVAVGHLQLRRCLNGRETERVRAEKAFPRRKAEREPRRRGRGPHPRCRGRSCVRRPPRAAPESDTESPGRGRRFTSRMSSKRDRTIHRQTWSQERV